MSTWGVGDEDLGRFGHLGMWNMGGLVGGHLAGAAPTTGIVD